jgi:hypothetical protein
MDEITVQNDSALHTRHGDYFYIDVPKAAKLLEVVA